MEYLMGKGSNYRPYNKKIFDENFIQIFGEKDVNEIHRDKTRGLNISWPEINGQKEPYTIENSKNGKKRMIVCSFCGHKYVPGEEEPCDHIKKFAKQCEEWLKQ